MIRAEIAQVRRAPARTSSASRSSRCCSKPLSAEDGTLTRTFKPRRPAIFAKYAREVEEVLGKAALKLLGKLPRFKPQRPGHLCQNTPERWRDVLGKLR